MQLKRGRPYGIHTPIKYHTEEERKQARAISRKEYVQSKPWYCTVCERQYVITSKWPHLNSKKHKMNEEQKEQEKN